MGLPMSTDIHDRQTAEVNILFRRPGFAPGRFFLPRLKLIGEEKIWNFKNKGSTTLPF